MSGCVAGPDRDPGLTSAIKEHYAAYATEEQGACRTPRIDTIQDHQLLETTLKGEETLLVQYSYFDRHADMDANWSRFVHLGQTCGGLAERRFVLTKGDLGYQVKAMGGEHRNDGSKP